MIGLDTNVLIDYLVAEQSDHDRVRDWMAGNTQPLVTTWINAGEVLRLLTHPRVFKKPATLAQALATVEELQDARQIEFLPEPEDWTSRLADIATTHPSIRGNEIFDARIAICLAYHGVRQILTRDSDFLKYDFLSVVAP